MARIECPSQSLTIIASHLPNSKSKSNRGVQKQPFGSLLSRCVPLLLFEAGSWSGLLSAGISGSANTAGLLLNFSKFHFIQSLVNTLVLRNSNQNYVEILFHTRKAYNHQCRLGRRGKGLRGHC